MAIPLRRFCLCLFACLLCPLVMVADNGASDSLRALRSRLIERFTPLMRDVAAISPDGEHLAYTLRDEENLYVIIVATKAPARCVVSYKIGSMASSRLLNPNYEPSPEVLKIVPHHVDFGRAPRIRTMLWANSKCLLAITNFTATRMDGLERYENEEGALFRLSLDGKGAKMLASVNELGREFAYVYTFQDFVMAGEDEEIGRAHV